MKINASGRAALILATGLFACFAAPSLAPAGTDGSNSVRHYRHYVHHRSGKVAVKSSDSKKEAATDTAENAGVNPATLPPSVANANAQLAAANTLADSARAMTARANDIMQAAADSRPATESQRVAPDQLNDVDRALREDPPPQQTTLAMSSADAAAASATPVMASSENSSWDQSSLIGEICIAAGALLTLASAARMFMA
jgi:ABC-type transporter Mla subunit MlaD